MNQSNKKRKLRCRCQKKLTTTEKCPGSLLLVQENNIPIFVCDFCGSRDETWKRFYDEYLKLYEYKDNWTIPKHKISCIIGQFCHLYKKRYDVDYLFVPKNPNPYGAKECRDANILLSTFKGDALEVRKYLIWAFKCGIPRNSKITSVGYLCVEGLIRKYMLSEEKRNIFSRTSKLTELTEWCNKNNIKYDFELETMNDLGAILNYTIQNNLELKNDCPEKIIIGRAKEMGLIDDNNLLKIGKIT